MDRKHRSRALSEGQLGDDFGQPSLLRGDVGQLFLDRLALALEGHLPERRQLALLHRYPAGVGSRPITRTVSCKLKHALFLAADLLHVPGAVVAGEGEQVVVVLAERRAVRDCGISSIRASPTHW